MNSFEGMSFTDLRKAVETARTHLDAKDAGTGKTHMNEAEVLSAKTVVAQELNRMAFHLYSNGQLLQQEFTAITDGCRPYLIHAKEAVASSR